MKINLTHILISFIVVIGLIAGNVYQYQNPKVVEVPTGQESIDSTAWVSQVVHLTHGMIIDSLRAKNKKLAQRIEESKDKIASYTSINGMLKMKLDSVKNAPSTNNIDLNSLMLKDGDLWTFADTAFTRTEYFGNNLFEISAVARFLNDSLSLDIKKPIQQRPIELDVATTFNEDRSRMLTYVTSPDFDSLRYKSYTELEPKNRIPRLWIGAGGGVIVTLGTILLLR